MDIVMIVVGLNLASFIWYKIGRGAERRNPTKVDIDVKKEEKKA